MSNFLVRGIRPRARKRLEELAERENLSINQYFLRMVDENIKKEEKEGNEEERRADAFRRLREIRERFRKKYGRMEDSTKLIREDRDSR